MFWTNAGKARVVKSVYNKTTFRSLSSSPRCSLSNRRRRLENQFSLQSGQSPHLNTRLDWPVVSCYNPPTDFISRADVEITLTALSHGHFLTPVVAPEFAQNLTCKSELTLLKQRVVLSLARIVIKLITTISRWTTIYVVCNFNLFSPCPL